MVVLETNSPSFPVVLLNEHAPLKEEDKKIEMKDK
jgi:hypothetical protein